MSQEGYISLYQFTKRIEGALKDPAIRFQWITLEINSISVHQGSGHCYLEAVEKAPNGATIASARANIWSSNYIRISTKFKAATGMGLQRGMKILANVTASYHSLYGLSLSISDIDPTFTLGESERIRRETMQRLRSDGIWDMNRTLPREDLITRLAVVSSPTAAGYGDFCHQIEESGLKISITLFDSLMQGNQAERSLLDSLERICNATDNYDAIVIIRGGGATGDMDCFDGYMVCSAIAQMPLPVITGIGHDRDTSIADMVAAVPLKTPTAVAAWIVDHVWEYINTMEKHCSEINAKAKTTLIGMWSILENRASTLAGNTAAILSEKQLHLSECRNNLARIASAVAVNENGRIAKVDEMIKASAVAALTTRISKTDILRQELLLKWNKIYTAESSGIERKVQDVYTLAKSMLDKKDGMLNITGRNLAGSVALYKEKVSAAVAMAESRIKAKVETILKMEYGRQENLQRLLYSHDPSNVLSRGYALVKKNGKVMPSKAGLQVGDNIEIMLRDATLHSEIKKIK